MKVGSEFMFKDRLVYWAESVDGLVSYQKAQPAAKTIAQNNSMSASAVDWVDCKDNRDEWWRLSTGAPAKIFLRTSRPLAVT